MQLIWLDNTPCSVHIQSKLLQLYPIVQFYTDINQCIISMKSIQDEQIILIVSMALSKSILSQVHSLQLLSIVFVVGSSVNENQTIDLTNEYKKIIEIHTDYDLLLKSLEQSINILEQQIFSFNVFNQNKDYSNDLSKSSASFLWYQLLIDILKQMPNNENFNKNIFDSYNESCKTELSQFKQDYSREKCIQLYNEQHFIHRFLNKALRTKNIELIYVLQHFIIDIYDQIKLAKESFEKDKLLNLFYWKRVSKIELEQFKNYIGFYISANGFLPVSFNKDNAIKLAKNKIFPNETEAILFQFEINSNSDQITYIEIHNKQEIIFNLDTVFRLHSIEFDTDLDLWKIKLINDDSHRSKFQNYFQSIRNFRNENSFLIFFGHLFTDLDQSKQSEIYFHNLLKSLPSDHPDIASVYNQIGNFLADKGQLKLALENYELAYAIRQKNLSMTHPHIAISLNNIGLIYKDEGNFDVALDYCQKALKIDEINYPKNHIFKAMTIENIGGIYKEKHLFSQAQNYFLRALNMYKSVLTVNHPFLTDILNSLGKVYCDQGYYDRALTCYQKAFAICEINYPNDHLQKAQTIENIGLLYKTTGMLQKALEELTKALEMYRRLYSDEHPDIARCFGYIGLVYEASGDLDFALNYFNKQLNMDEKCLSSDHRNIQIDIEWIIDIYKKKQEIKRAFEFCQKKYQEKKNLFGENHSMTLAIFMMMSDLCDDTNLKSNYYKQALFMHENLKPPDVYATIKCLDIMINFYFKNNLMQEALDYQIKMIDLERQLFTNDHINLGLSLQRLGEIYESLSKQDEAEKCYSESKLIFERYDHNHKNTEFSHLMYSQSNFTKSRVCILQ